VSGFQRMSILTTHVHQHLRAARRPKPPSLKEQALAASVSTQMSRSAMHEEVKDDLDIIRRALESLPD
jgi:hypothetical protein